MRFRCPHNANIYDADFIWKLNSLSAKLVIEFHQSVLSKVRMPYTQYLRVFDPESEIWTLNRRMCWYVNTHLEFVIQFIGLNICKWPSQSDRSAIYISLIKLRLKWWNILVSIKKARTLEMDMIMEMIYICPATPTATSHPVITGLRGLLPHEIVTTNTRTVLAKLHWLILSSSLRLNHWEAWKTHFGVPWVNPLLIMFLI